MNTRHSAYIALVLGVLIFSACGERPAPATAPPLSEETSAVPAEAMPTPPMTPAVEEEPGVIGFQGFGPARFGDREEAVRIAWGRPLTVSGAEPDACRQLFPEPRPQHGFAISFMLVDGKFARYDIDSERYTAPGGGQVGSSTDQILEKYEGRVEQTPHKYVDGAQVLIVTPAEGGDARLIFETTAQGQVNRWRIGVPPAVHYVEGCS